MRITPISRVFGNWSTRTRAVPENPSLLASSCFTHDIVRNTHDSARITHDSALSNTLRVPRYELCPLRDCAVLGRRWRAKYLELVVVAGWQESQT